MDVIQALTNGSLVPWLALAISLASLIMLLRPTLHVHWGGNWDSWDSDGCSEGGGDGGGGGD